MRQVTRTFKAVKSCQTGPKAHSSQNLNNQRSSKNRTTLCLKVEVSKDPGVVGGGALGNKRREFLETKRGGTELFQGSTQMMVTWLQRGTNSAGNKNHRLRVKSRHEAAGFSAETGTNKQTNNWMWVVGDLLKPTLGQELNYNMLRDQLTGFTCRQTPPTRALTLCLPILHCSKKGERGFKQTSEKVVSVSLQYHRGFSKINS